MAFRPWYNINETFFASCTAASFRNTSKQTLRTAVQIIIRENSRFQFCRNSLQNSLITLEIRYKHNEKCEWRTEQGQYLSQRLHEQASPSRAVLLAGAEVVLHACGRRPRCSASAPSAPSPGNNHPSLAALTARTHTQNKLKLYHIYGPARLSNTWNTSFCGEKLFVNQIKQF